MPLELLPEKDRIERDLVRGDLHDAEPVEERPAGLAVEPDELVVRRAAVQDAARVAVDVREYEVDVVLAERVEARSVLEDPADLSVVALDMGFLRRAVGIAVEEMDPARDFLRRVVDRVRAVLLDHLGIGELRAVVGKYDEEQLSEEFRSSDLPELVEHPRASLRCLRVPEESEHDAARKIDREEHLASDAADDGVQFGTLLDPVRLAEHDEFPVGPADAAFRVGLRLLRFLSSPAAAGFGEVSADDVEEPARDVVVDRALLDTVEDLGIVVDDVAH